MLLFSVSAGGRWMMNFYTLCDCVYVFLLIFFFLILLKATNTFNAIANSLGFIWFEMLIFLLPKITILFTPLSFKTLSLGMDSHFATKLNRILIHSHRSSIQLKMLRTLNYETNPVQWIQTNVQIISIKWTRWSRLRNDKSSIPVFFSAFWIVAYRFVGWII